MLESEEAGRVCVESWRTWYTLLLYGLALDTFRYSHSSIVHTLYALSYLLRIACSLCGCH